MHHLSHHARRLAALAALAALLAPAPAAATTVLLLAADEEADVVATKDALVATGRFVEADLTVLAGTATPDLSALAGQDVVLVWAELTWDDVDGLGDLLADHLDADGEVVLAAHALEEGLLPGGRFSGEGDSPFLATTAAPVAGDVDLTSPSTDLGHPVLDGLTSIVFPDRSQGAPALSAGGQLVAVDTAGAPVVADLCDRNVIALNLFPPDLALGEPDTSADAALMLAQALEATQLDAPPTASAGGPYTVTEGATITLDGSTSGEGDLGPLSFSWDLDGDGVLGDSTAQDPVFDASTLDGPSSVTVTLEVTDSCGRTATDTADVTVDNVAPTIDSTSHEGPQPEGSPVGFTATSSDPGPDTLTFTWDFGDGSPTVTDEAPAHTYDDEGTWTVTLVVDDGDGGTDTDTLTVDTTNVAPTIDSMTQDGPQPEGSAVGFTASASDPGADTLTFTWDFGDGSPTVAGSSPAHVYSDEGTWTVTLVVDDGDGGTDTDTLSVQTTNVAPTIDSMTQDGPVPEGSPVHLSASASDPGADTLTFTWDFGDSSAPATGLSVSHTYGDGGTYTVTLTVDDGDGGSDAGTIPVQVTNEGPTIDWISQDGPVPEVSPVNLSASASDPGADTLTYTWDFGDGSPTETGQSVSHAYADDATWHVVLTVDDGDGGVAAGSIDVVVTNLAPSITALVGDGAGVLGETLAFAGAATDPAGTADVLTWAWSWDDGSPADSGVDLDAASHAWSQPGSFDVLLQVADEDGGSTSAELTVTITSQGPTLALSSGPAAVDEEATGSFTVASAGPLGGPVDVAWAWGDGSPVESGAGLLTAAHAWADDGTVTVGVTATDTWGASASTSFDVDVTNLPPAFTSTPPGAAVQGEAFTWSPTATDVAADLGDLAFALLSGPPTATFDVATCLLVWFPTFADALGGPHDFTVQVSDGDGGVDAVSWQVDVTFADADADGMPDTWELSNGLDPTVDDATADDDGDGVSNLGEWLAGTDPQGFGGPGEPVLLEPIGEEPVLVATPQLVLSNATDPDGDPLVYDFEVYADEALTTLLDGATGVTEGSGSTSWTGTVTLPEDALAWWRARARDPLVAGPWAKAEGFFVDEANDPPTAPQPLSPMDTTVASPVPELLAAAPVDPEGDDLDVTFELFDGASTLVEVVVATDQGDGTWHGVPLSPLPEDVIYGWGGRAVDERGGDSGLSDLVFFAVDVTNTTPEAPTALLPEANTEIDTAFPLLVVEAGVDPDGDPVQVRFAVDIRADFDSPERQDLGATEPAADGEAEVEVPLPLPENGVTWARARTEDDRGGASAWTAWSFRVNAVAEAAGPVRIVAPGEDEAVDGTAVTIRWAVAQDPDGDELTYELAVAAEQEGGAGERDLDDPLWSADGLTVPIGESEGEATVDVELAAGPWLVRGRATDPGGLSGDWGPVNRFVVLPPSGEPVDLDPGDGPYGCDCSVSRGADTAGWLVLLLVAGAALRRRSRTDPR